MPNYILNFVTSWVFGNMISDNYYWHCKCNHKIIYISDKPNDKLNLSMDNIIHNIGIIIVVNTHIC